VSEVTPREKILDKVRKVKRLAEAAGTDGEAQAALLQMQKLMAKYSIVEDELIVEDDVLDEQVNDLIAEESGVRTEWKLRLARIICRNFRCDWYMSRGWTGEYTRDFRAKTSMQLKFIGMDSDVKLAVETYQMTLTVIKRLSRRYLEERRKQDGLFGYGPGDPVGISKGQQVKASYITGFLYGLDEAFKVQVQQSVEAGNGQAIVLVKRDAVVKAYKNLNLKNAAPSTARYGSDSSARERGQADGKAYGSGRAIDR
jgi:hypothetical protein